MLLCTWNVYARRHFQFSLKRTQNFLPLADYFCQVLTEFIVKYVIVELTYNITKYYSKLVFCSISVKANLRKSN